MKMFKTNWQKIPSIELFVYVGPIIGAAVNRLDACVALLADFTASSNNSSALAAQLWLSQNVL